MVLKVLTGSREGSGKKIERSRGVGSHKRVRAKEVSEDDYSVLIRSTNNEREGVKE